YSGLFMVRRFGLFQAHDRKSKASRQFCLEVMGTVRFGNDHVAAILGFGDLQWGNILITRVYFVEGLGQNLFSVGQFCDSNLEAAFRRNACFVRNLEGVDLLKGDRLTTLYTINLHEMASASPICLMARASSTNKKQKANVLINESQKKQQPKVKKTKKVGFIERLATPKPSKPRSFLRWSPTGRLFDLKGKKITFSEPESQSDGSKGDNACTANPLEPMIKRFPNLTFSLAGIDNTKTRRSQPRSNTKNDRVPSASKSSQSKNKEVEVEEHHMNLLLSKNSKHMLSACNNFKFNSHNIIIKLFVLCVIQICLWCADSGCSKHMTKNLKLLINFVWMFMGTVHFGNDHVAAILGFGDLQWGNILITRVYFVEGLGHNLFSVRQLCDSNLEVAFRRNACFVRNLDRVDLLKGDRSTYLYTINLHEMASASPICLMARASSTKSWLWHQRLSHLNFDTINDLARNDLVSGLLNFKYHKEHLCPSCEQGKRKRASHPPKPVPNSRERLHLLHTDLCGPLRIASINGKRYVLVIVDDYSRYTWVYFLRSKDEAPEVIKTFLKRITVLLQSPVIIIRTDNGTEFKNQVLKEYFDSIATACFTQNRSIIYRRFNKTPYKLINDRKPDISFLHVFGALCYPKNDREDIGKPGAKGELDLLFEAMYDDYIGGQPSATARSVPAAQAPQLRQTSTTSITIAETTPTPTNSSSLATNFPNTSQDVNELNLQQQHAQQQGIQAHL
nr:retrovirus-related Pol polyprotein from transposon TNT 1-94 [Tanacetum cinerariifolium]